MINQSKVRQSELVKIPLKTTAFSEYTAGIAKWVKENPEKSKWQIIDMKVHEVESVPEILIILAQPEEKKDEN